MKSTFFSFSFGCRVNQAEKEMLDKELVSKGFSYTENSPQYFIVNTCAITSKAEREVRQLIYQINRKYPKTIIVITGCAATKWIKEGKKIKGINLTVDNTDKEYLAELINSNFKTQITKRNLKTKNLNSQLLNKFISSGRMFLKIQDGCQRFCTFCIVPYLRGQPKSFSIKYLISSIKGLEKNVKEVILTAINTQAYGFDTGEKFTDLITSILENTPIERLSFGSIHPWSIDNAFLSLYEKLKDNQRFAKYLHIPLQSGSNKILSNMKRGYTQEELSEKLNKLHLIYPLTFFGTDIITGFLEETDHDFQETYDFLNKSPIAKFHVFRFNKRDKTAAFYMSKKLKEPTPAQKAKRSQALIELSQKKYQKFLGEHLNQSFPALILKRKTKDLQEALLFNQIPVLVKAAEKDISQIKTVKILSQKYSTLMAEII